MNLTSKSIVAIIRAAGRGERFGGELPKQYYKLNGYPLIYYQLKMLNELEIIKYVVVAIEPLYFELMKSLIQQHQLTKVFLTVGGNNPCDSMLNGFQFIRETWPNQYFDYILVNDGARVLTTKDDIVRVIEKADHDNLPAVAYKLPLRYEIVSLNPDQTIKSSLTKTELYEYHYPIVLTYSIFTKIYETISEDQRQELGYKFYLLLDAMNQKLTLIEGDPVSLLKLTFPHDLEIIKAHLPV